MHYRKEITSHIHEIERCKQRSGRFLSIIDLLDAGTLDLDLAAYLGAAILKGNSFLAGGNKRRLEDVRAAVVEVFS